jgi:hypothetical protein
MYNRDDPGPERRQSGRTRLRAEAALTVPGRRIAARLENASRGGALLYLEEEVQSGGGPYAVSIAFGRDPEEAISAHIRVVQAARRLMRIQWKDPLPPEDWIKLRQLIEREFGVLTVVQGRLPMLVWPSFPPRLSGIDDTGGESQPA